MTSNGNNSYDDRGTEDGSESGLQTADLDDEWGPPPDNYVAIDEGEEILYTDPDENLRKGVVDNAGGGAVVVENNDTGRVRLIVPSGEQEILGVRDETTPGVDGKQPQVREDVSLDAVPAHVEDEFGVDLDDTVTIESESLSNGNDTGFESLGMSQSSLENALVEAGNEREAAETVVSLLRSWKMTSGDGGAEDAETLEAIAKRALGQSDTPVRQIGDVSAVNWPKVNEDTIDAYQDLTRLSRAFAEKNLADSEGKVRLYRGLAHEPNNVRLVERLAKSDSEGDSLQITMNTTANTTLSRDVAESFSRAFVIENEFSVDDIAVATDMLLIDGDMEAEVTVVGGKREIDAENIRITSSSRRSMVGEYGNGKTVTEAFESLDTPEDASPESYRTVNRFFSEWEEDINASLDLPASDPRGVSAHRQFLTDREAVETVVEAVRYAERNDVLETHEIEALKQRVEAVSYGSVDWNAATVTQGMTDEFNPDVVDEWSELSEYAAIEGVTSDAMSVGELPETNPETVGDAGLVFKTEYGSGVGEADTDLGRRSKVAYEVAETLNANVPTHVGDPDSDGWVAVKGIPDGKEVRRASDELCSTVSAEEFYAEAAKQVVINNNDCHPDNVFVTASGDVYFHDLDHTAGRLTSDFVGNKPEYDSNIDRTLGELDETARELGFTDEPKEKILSRAEEIADEIDAGVVDDVNAGTDTLRSNIKENIRDLQDGRVRGKWEQ